MNLDSEAVKNWLSRSGRNREWLADQCGANKRTVDNWLSTQAGIPAKAELIIERLMREDAATNIATGQTPPPAFITVSTSLSEYRSWENVALKSGKTLTEWALEVIRDAHKTELKSGEGNAPSASGKTSADTSAPKEIRKSQKKTGTEE